MDHTLIHTTNQNVDADLEGVHHYELTHRHVWYHTKFRPGYKDFLERMSKIFELHIVTFGDRSYAHKIADLMDPGRIYFHDRILSRNEIINQTAKTDNLKYLFPCGDLMVCIIDDRDDVWNYAKNLIMVKPYVYFKNTGDINDPTMNSNTIPTDLSEGKSEVVLEDKDDYLNYLEKILQQIHDRYYQELDENFIVKNKSIENFKDKDLPDVKNLLPELKSEVLKDVVITFSGVIPTGYDMTRQRCYQMAISLGAQVNTQLTDPQTTHLVAANYGTSKVHEAQKLAKTNNNIHIVTPEWLIECNYKWIRCDESDYQLTRTYDYKYCLFHIEYNIGSQRHGSKRALGEDVNSNSKKHKIVNTDTDESQEAYLPSFSRNELDIMDKEVNEICNDEDDEESIISVNNEENEDNSREDDNDTSSTNSGDNDEQDSLSSIDDDMIKALEERLQN